MFHVIKPLQSYTIRIPYYYNHILLCYVGVHFQDIYFNNAKAVAVDLESANGVIYLLDTVLDVPEGTIYEILEKPEYKLTQFKKAVDSIRYDRMLNLTYNGGQFNCFSY